MFTPRQRSFNVTQKRLREYLTKPLPTLRKCSMKREKGMSMTFLSGRYCNIFSGFCSSCDTNQPTCAANNRVSTCSNIPICSKQFGGSKNERWIGELINRITVRIILHTRLVSEGRKKGTVNQGPTALVICCFVLSLAKSRELVTVSSRCDNSRTVHWI